MGITLVYCQHGVYNRAYSIRVTQSVGSTVINNVSCMIMLYTYLLIVETHGISTHNESKKLVYGYSYI